MFISFHLDICHPLQAGAPIPPAPASSPAPSMAAPVMAGGVACHLADLACLDQ